MTTYYDTGTHTYKITTSSPQAQIWFDRGLMWAYGFNYEESARCFRQAAQADPECAMAHWGVAYAAGPNYNRPWQNLDAIELPRILEETHAAATRAVALSASVSKRERVLIDAIAQRHPSNNAPEEFALWTNAYADAMRSAYRLFPDDADICALYSDALMSCTPWKLWDLRTGKPSAHAHTVEVREALERAMAQMDANGELTHPGVLHYYIHLMEMSPTPEAALRAGDALRGLVPDSGHLYHMPTHIDFQCGHYHNVVLRNSEAIVADRKVLERQGPLNLYSYSRIHNIHFKLYGAMFLGQYQTAMEAVREFEETVPEAIIRMESPPMADILEGYYGLKYHALIRFGRWHEIVEQPVPHDPDLYLVTTAISHYAKTVAHAALGEVDTAEFEADKFANAVSKVPVSRTLFNNTCVDILGVAGAMLQGEIDYRCARHEQAFERLRTAVDLEDNLPYDEPWGWMQPARHALGALLLEQGRVEEAEPVYRADLGLDSSVIRARHHPDNVWSLHGLHECLRRQGKHAEADTFEPRLKLAAARADVPIKSSCYCRLSHVA